MSSPGKPAIVVFSTLFPNSAQPLAGVFIRERMFRVGQRLPVTVVSPQPWFPLQSVLRWFKPHFRPPVERHELQQGVEIIRPRFLCVPMLFKSLDGWFLALAAYRTLRRLKRAGRLDVLDAHFAYPDGFAASRLANWLAVPLTITLRGTEARHVQSPLLRGLVTKALLAASRVFSVSTSLKNVALSCGIAPEHVEVVGNGVDAEKFSPVDRAQARAELQLPGSARILVTVGALVERKGFHRVIACMPSLMKRHADLHYLMIGGSSPEGDWTDRLRELVSELGLSDRVHFLGPVAPENLHLPLSAADVFVLATRNEGWANVLLEAMSCGLPVVATDVGGNAEVVCSAELGSIVPFGDQQALTQALDAALQARWDRSAIADYARANSWDQRVEVLVTEFRRLIENRVTPERSITARHAA